MWKLDYTRIQSLASEKGFSLYELADNIKISRAGLYKMLNNKSLRVDVLEKIASFLDVNPGYFFSGENENTKEVEAKLAAFDKLLEESYVRLWSLLQMDFTKIRGNFIDLLLDDSQSTKDLRENEKFQALSNSLRNMLNDPYLPDLLLRLNQTLDNPKIGIKINEVKEVANTSIEEDWGIKNAENPMESQKGKK